MKSKRSAAASVVFRNKLALAHIDIRDAVNKTLEHREAKAAEKVKDNPKYFYSYAKKFSKQ